MSDAVLDACLAQDPTSRVSLLLLALPFRDCKQSHRPVSFLEGSMFCLALQVACESATKTNMVMIFGEITTTAKVDYEKVVRDTVRNIGFTSDDVGIDADKMNVLVHIEEQSPDIGQGVHGMGTKTLEETGMTKRDVSVLWISESTYWKLHTLTLTVLRTSFDLIC